MRINNKPLLNPFQRKGLFLLLALVLLPSFWEGLGMGGNLFAQTKQIDSLLTLLKTAQEDTNKVIRMNDLSNEYRLIDEYESGLTYSKKALALAKILSFKKGIVTSYNLIGIAYKNQGNYSEALKNYFASLKIKEEIGDKQGIANSCNNIGIVFQNQGNYPDALKNYLTALKIYKEVENKKGIAASYMNIGTVYYRQSNYPESLKNLFTALKIYEEIKYKQGIAASYNSIGVIYDEQGNNLEALKNYFISLKIKEEIDDKEGMVSSFINLGQIYTKLNKRQDADIYLHKALRLSKDIERKKDTKETYAALTVLDSTKGDFKSAFENHKLYIVYRDSLDNEESKVKSLKIANQYESEKKEKEIAQLNLDVLTKQKAVEEKNIILYATITGAVLIILSGFLLYSRQRLKTKQNKIIVEKEQAFLQSEKRRAEEELAASKTLLMNYTESLIQKNELIENYTHEIEKLKGLKASEIYAQKIDQLTGLTNATILTNEDWEKFKTLFENVYKGFFIRLKDKMPDLTNAEIRLMSLIKLNLDTKQMANMLGVSPETITKTKYRLRKKVNLPEGEAIETLINKC